MAIYFGKVGLRADNDALLLISNMEILRQCINHPFDTINVSRIIFESVEKATGEKVSPKIGYNQSQLFCWLEHRIQADARYAQAKATKMQENNEKRKCEKLYQQADKMRRSVYFSEEKKQRERKRMLQYYRSKFKR